MGADLTGFIRCRAKGEDAELDVAIPMSHHLQRMFPLRLYLMTHNTDRQCSKTCPKGLNPAAAIAKMKLEMATNADAA
jgi:hypothetical protein